MSVKTRLIVIVLLALLATVLCYLSCEDPAHAGGPFTESPAKSPGVVVVPDSCDSVSVLRDGTLLARLLPPWKEPRVWALHPVRLAMAYSDTTVAWYALSAEDWYFGFQDPWIDSLILGVHEYKFVLHGADPETVQARTLEIIEDKAGKRYPRFVMEQKAQKAR